MSYLWTSEAVAAGHPDKVADQVADAILDSYLANDPFSRVACEVTLTTDLAFVTGEITSKSKPEIEKIVRNTICKIGYDRPENGYDGNTITLLDKIKEQSPEISKAVTGDGENLGAGDQGIMFGYATDEAKFLNNSYMPLAHTLSFEMIRMIEDDIRQGRVEDKWESPLLPDAKSQATILYNADGEPAEVNSVLISVCHKKEILLPDLKLYVAKLFEKFQPWQILLSALPLGLKPGSFKLLINPAGAWSFGGPAADTGLSGRKIVVDNYGADCPVGGGSFSGKDPTKVDRSAAYAARHVAKNIVAAELAKKCQVQIAYAIGVAEPVSVRVQTFNTHSRKHGIRGDDELEEMVRELISLTPKAIIDRFQLRRPIYKNTAAGGHFGRDGFPWEELNLVHQFQEHVKF